MAEDSATEGPRRYQPSNGTEGMWFTGEWCDRCRHDEAARKGRPEDGCKILAHTMCLDYNDPDYPSEWRYDEDGIPQCTAFERELTADEKAQEAERKRVADLEKHGQGRLFGGDG